MSTLEQRTNDGFQQIAADIKSLQEQINALADPALPRREEWKSGRFYLYSDGRWVGANNINYGSNYHQWANNGGTSALPILSWLERGDFINAGERVKEFRLIGRTSNLTDVSDVQVVLTLTRPTNPAAWLSGFDNNAEITEDIIHNDMFKNPANGVDVHTGSLNDTHHRMVPLDFVAPEDGFLNLWVKPVRVGDSTTLRYMLATYGLKIDSA